MLSVSVAAWAFLGTGEPTQVLGRKILSAYFFRGFDRWAVAGTLGHQPETQVRILPGALAHKSQVRYHFPVTRWRVHAIGVRLPLPASPAASKQC